MRSAAAFQSRIVPSSRLLIMASAEDRTMAASRDETSSAALRWLMSRFMDEAPTTVPETSRIGEIVRSTGNRDPSFRIRVVSKWATGSPRETRRSTIRSSSWRSWGMSLKMELPTISSVE
jgi:hypothetical protein